RPIDPAAGVKAQRRALYRLGAERYQDLALLVAADGGMAETRLRELLTLAAGWKRPVFPLAGHDMTALGIPPGPRVGQLLGELRSWWEDGDFAADRAACLERLQEVARMTG
ncbi:MAG: CCA tRNA nucleotidyltransferase, partial [Stellaceae bacterium]